MPPGPQPASSRLIIRSIHDDPRGVAIRDAAAHHGIDLGGPVGVADIVFVAGELSDDDRRELAAFLADPLLQTASWEAPSAGDPATSPDSATAYEVTFHPGVTDGAADALMQAAAHLGVKVTAAASGRRIEFPAGTDHDTLDVLLRRVVANPVIERWAPGRIEPAFAPTESIAPQAAVVPIRNLDEAGLAALNVERAMALDPAELLVIQAHFVDLRRDPTDVELETLAQTWSEHCAHKTFRAAITVRDADGATSEIAPLLRQLRDATDRVDAPFVRSAFVGNAGIVSFAEGESLALKAETHNHPSAVEPFGGANTGVGGVIRDVMGAGHKPFAVTDILCFGPADTPDGDVPDGSLHPRRIIAGVVDGVADYGNKIGLPNVAGAVLYDPAFTTNPLVFAGCIGVADDDPKVAVQPGPHPGDRVVVIGGATGRDGIHGATFSSLAMDASTGEVAGASVQIGDPVTEKLLIDVLDESRHLWTAITDCGAGGLSSAVGEMAAEPVGEHGLQAIGADVDLLDVPLKYPGLEPWEIWLSEAQERMVLAVAPADVDELRAVCARHRVDLADIGEFTGSGRLVVRVGSQPVLDLDVGFLHDGRPQRRMTAEANVPSGITSGRVVDDPGATLLALLAHPNIASKADVVHRYDHEIGGNTLVRPLVGDDDHGHADGVVLARPGSSHGVAVGIGVNPWHGVHDPKAMAHAAVDEAIRNVVAVGADPDRVALLDNFSWGDPRDEATLGGLAAAVAGCCDAALAYEAPFVSGKDSLNNTYTGRDGLRHAVPPTLVITAVAHVPDAAACVTTEFTAAGNVLVQLGPTGEHFAGSHLDLIHGVHGEPSPEAGVVAQPDANALGRYRALHAAILDGTVKSCHDVSEGGLAVAVAEMCIASGLGASVTVLAHHDVEAALFSESSGRLVAEVAASDADAFVARFDGIGGATVIGTVTGDAMLTITDVARIAVADLTAAFTGRGQDSSTIWARNDADLTRSVPRPSGDTIRAQTGASGSAPTAVVIAGPGTNRDPDVAFALELAGFEPQIALVDDLLDRSDPFADAQVIVVAGGFSYGDALGAGRMLGLDLTAAHGGRLGDALRRAVAADTPVLGICNGFQVLTRTGLLPGALGHNESGHFDCRWVTLDVAFNSRSVWTRDAVIIDCPIAHGEGRYVHPDPAALDAAGQVALRYAGANPNGSVDDIAGVSDETGLVLGLMPHPENHAVAQQHPRHRLRPGTDSTLGLTLFRSARSYLE
ncbi:phosphoribosylformylglycinamidine synthase subunit PurL [Desertimonas flava]|uniref:phosphoribosylformylglycinamidine synthase subunit PurL n=1 Tax=Desertimonas flava TaxID=2064846 RepID=UPI0013C45480|nr:phosphoribosylformylglycinamidine synthase subunit PurL [Desertimonas flava]